MIEAMVRLNLRVVDHLHIIDNDSTDGTFDVLHSLRDEGLPLSLSRDMRTGHLQTQLLNEFLVNEARAYAPDRVVTLDADEILCGDPIEFRRECAATEHCIQLNWKTYVATSSDKMDFSNPVKRITHRRIRETPQYGKCVLPDILIGIAKLSAGSHGARFPNGKMTPIKLSKTMQLAHFPVRSVSQITSKALIGHWNLNLRSAHGGEGYQWHKIAEEILKKGTLSSESFLRISANYAARENVDLVKEPLWPDGISLNYTRPSVAAELANLAAFTETLVNQVRKSNSERKIAIDELPRPSNIVRTICNDKPVDFCVVHPNDEIQKHHLRGEFYEKEELGIISEHFPANGTYLDIGANVGNHAVYCGLFLKPKKIILAEPNPEAIKVLHANILLNGLVYLCDTTRLGVGIGDRATTNASLSWRHPRWHKRNLGGAQLSLEGGDLKIVTDDTLVGEERIDFIKIDVEGMEIVVLRGLTETITRCRPKLFVEVDNINKQAMHEWLSANKYLVAEQFSRYPSNINYMCLPEEIGG